VRGILIIIIIIIIIMTAAATLLRDEIGNKRRPQDFRHITMSVMTERTHGTPSVSKKRQRGSAGSTSHNSRIQYGS
jgi:hypothetical protein